MLGLFLFYEIKLKLSNSRKKISFNLAIHCFLNLILNCSFISFLILFDSLHHPLSICISLILFFGLLQLIFLWKYFVFMFLASTYLACDFFSPSYIISLDCNMITNIWYDLSFLPIDIPKSISILYFQIPFQTFQIFFQDLDIISSYLILFPIFPNHLSKPYMGTLNIQCTKRLRAPFYDIML